MAKDLSRYGSGDLEAELARRQHKDIYYIVGHPAAGRHEKPDFLIVHKRYWHLNHSVEDRHISRLLRLPRGFDEDQESTFAYGGPTKEGEELLQHSGLTKHEEPFWWCHGAHTFHCPLDGHERVTYICDTPRIRQLVTAWMPGIDRRFQQNPSAWGKAAYQALLRPFTQANGLQAAWTRDSGIDPQTQRWQGGKVSLLDKAVAESLPAYSRAWRRQEDW
jgi:hypothetical protein